MGRRPLYREASEGARERYMGKISANSSWFQKKGEPDITMEDFHTKGPSRKHPWRKQDPPKGPDDDRRVVGVIFVPHTADSDLQRKLQAVDNEVTRALKMPRTRYIERAGVTLKDLLVKKDPWFKLKGGCERPTCHICSSQGGKGTSCRREGTIYEIECKACKELSEGGGGEGERKEGGLKVKYIGETSRSTYERLQEHMWLFTNKKEGDPDKGEASSALWLHSREDHGGDLRKEDWGSRVISSHFTALNRQVTEAVLIAEKGGG